MAAEVAGCILTPHGFVSGTLQHLGGRIRRVSGQPIDDVRARDGAHALVLPGFIDSHVHGGGGSDTMQGGDAIDRIARLHVRHGTTALLATTMTAPPDELVATVRGVVGATPVRPAVPPSAPEPPVKSEERAPTSY